MQNPQIFVHTHGTAGFYKRISDYNVDEMNND